VTSTPYLQKLDLSPFSLYFLCRARAKNGLNGNFDEFAMPSPKDITGDLSRMHRKPLNKRGMEPDQSGRIAFRKMAFDPLLWLTLLLLAVTISCQLGLLIWKL
jgi:hypothetical protein